MASIGSLALAAALAPATARAEGLSLQAADPAELATQTAKKPVVMCAR